MSAKVDQKMKKDKRNNNNEYKGQRNDKSKKTKRVNYRWKSQD